MKAFAFLTTLMLLFSFSQTACSQQTPASGVENNGSKIEKPIMAFEKKMHDFGVVTLGDNPTYTYKFVNKGNADLKIEIVSGCDCTKIVWPEGKTFKPGEGGEITITFLTEKEEEKGVLDKTIDILLENVDPETGYPMMEELKYMVDYKG
jgi:hypothetical protein